MNKKNNKSNRWYKKKENWVIGIGVLIAIFGIAVPFLLLHFKKWDLSKSTFDSLAPIGDFLGGSTVGLLSFASTILVIAAIIMQKEELRLQREELEKTRQEHHLTNDTMKRQQFETTFFNMINLHQSILREIKIDNDSGRVAIRNLHPVLKELYLDKVYKDFKDEIINIIINNQDKEEFNTVLKEIYFDLELNYFLEVARNNIPPMFDEDMNFDDSEYDKYVSKVLMGENRTWESEKERLNTSFVNTYKDNRSKSLELLQGFNFIKNRLPDAHIYNFRLNFNHEPLLRLKKQAYQALYSDYEPEIGHYYRNLYRLVKLIQSQVFDSESEEVNERERGVYRGILRAQLSSYELLMLYYNVNYSNKGEKFKELLKETNFFDDHLVEEDFIWANDKDELDYFEKSK
ncbi:putative phage abortive infection protein [Bacillus suaedae]|uniref:Phage abortive infection protein n=1 Tax=Halalkalibacter suaedae TaxID=2822140 RepID=A0A940WXV1_9BACI|nr:putative phage abortive infection protein [Bacillus suaedae]MBP3950316.1 putative phage abortive infection protein [Bacillus suaedae]